MNPNQLNSGGNDLGVPKNLFRRQVSFCDEKIEVVVDVMEDLDIQHFKKEGKRLVLWSNNGVK